MRKQWVLVGIVAATLAAGEALRAAQSAEAAARDGRGAHGPDRRIDPRHRPDHEAGDWPTASRCQPGTYQVRVTAHPAKPDAVGTTESLERWAEFLKGGKVEGREVVTIVPASEARWSSKDTPPPPGGVKVQMLRGNEYVRVWINRGGNHYLIHLPAAAKATP